MAKGNLFLFASRSSVSKRMKEVCKQFSKGHKINVILYERGVSKIGTNVKVNPLKLKVCGRDDMFSMFEWGRGGL